MSYSDEVARCFKENPDIINYSPKKLGEWFYVQGILYQSNVVAAVDSKLTHFIKHLTPEQYAKAKESWDAVQETGESKALESVDGDK